MRLFKFKFKKRKSRSALKTELEFYKQQLEKEQKRCDDIRGEKVNAEWEGEKIKNENEKLKRKIGQLEQESLARLNIINDERAKHKIAIDKAQRRIDKLEGRLEDKQQQSKNT